MSRAPYILLPPSESKEPGGRREAAPGSFDSALAQQRHAMRQALERTLAGATPEQAAKVLNVRDANLERALVAARQLFDGSAPLLPAWRRYSGVVWTHLDPASLHHHQRRRLLVPSGLYGLTSGTDAIADYRLTMKVSLDGVGNVAKYWRSCLTRVLEELPEAAVVSLLPREHAMALGTSDVLSRRLVAVSFVRHDGEGVAGHDAKAVKGVVARRVVVDGLAGLEGFHWRGWRGSVSEGRYVVRAPREASVAFTR